jgi:radical SAM protein with 4Fe4S-binding SPASM domain
MLNFFRRASKSKIGTGIMVGIGIAILAGFAASDISNFGSGNIGFGMGSSTLAEVGDQIVTDQEMSEAMQRRLQEVRQQNPQADYATIMGDFDVLLDAMIECGREFERRIIAGGSYPFANMISALEQVHRGTHRPYPCGAGASYLGVSASGGLFACHRFVEDDRAAMGTVIAGVDRQRQQVWLDERAVDRQEPCRSCWARYLCGGGCHHEVMHRGRTACDYIRGWLRYVLEAYVRISAAAPERLAYGQTSRV